MVNPDGYSLTFHAQKSSAPFICDIVYYRRVEWPCAPCQYSGVVPKDRFESVVIVVEYAFAILLASSR